MVTECSQDSTLRKKRGRRRKEDSVLNIRFRNNSTETASSSESSPQTTRHRISSTRHKPDPKPKRLLLKDIYTLIEEQRDFRRELEEAQINNINLENLLSNCTLKVEDINRKILLIEYELADISPNKGYNMKWEKEASGKKELRRIYQKKEDSGLDSPVFDNGRHKLEKYAKIHGIVDVEIDVYSSDMYAHDSGPMSDDDVSEPTFSITDKKDGKNNLSIDFAQKSSDLSDNSQYVDNSIVQLKEEIILKHEVVTNEYADDVLISPIHIPKSEELEFSMVYADDDIFSDNIDTTDTIEQIAIVLNNKKQSESDDIISKANSEPKLTHLVDMGVGDSNYVGCADAGTETMNADANNKAETFQTETAEEEIIGDGERHSDKIVIDTHEEIGAHEEVLGNHDDNKHGKDDKDDIILKLLEDLAITEDDYRTYNTPTITIKSGVEAGGSLLREHKGDASPDRTPSPHPQEDITTASRTSVCEFEDSDDDRRKRKRARPFPRRVARSFFANLCACWNH